MNRSPTVDRAGHRTGVRRLVAGIGSVALACCVTTAVAEPVDGLYVAADIAANEVQDTTYVLTGALTPRHPTTFDVGYAGSLRLGYGWQGPRVEVEAGHRSNEVNDFGPAGNTGPGAGTISATTLMFNGYYDIDTGSRFTPFVGAAARRHG
jgi:opacity protein-like surface antigen